MGSGFSRTWFFGKLGAFDAGTFLASAVRMVLESPGRSSIHLDPGDAKIVGRAAGVDIVIPEPSLSRRHARVRMSTEGVASVEDLASTNGVYVNGARRSVAVLTGGDAVRFGAVEYRVASREPSAVDALLSTSREMMAFGDLQALLDRVLDRLQAVLAADRTAILLVDRTTGELSPRAVRPPGDYARVSDCASSTAVRESLARHELLIVEDASADARLRDAMSVREAGVRSAICVPLLGRAGPVGALYADRLVAHGAFAADQVAYASAFAAHAAAAVETAQLYDDREQHFQLTLEALARAIDARDPYTAGHSERVTGYALSLSRMLRLPDADLGVLRRAGLLHDVGKIGVPDRVLLKAGPLDAAERAAVAAHVRIGVGMLRDLPFLRDALPAIRGHHERWDGRGYPDALAGDGIPLHARIMAVADSFDAMTSARPYRGALPVDEAARRLRAGAGTQFDADVVDAFERARFADGDGAAR